MLLLRRLRLVALSAMGACALAGAAHAADTGTAARDAYNRGDLATAAKLAESSHDGWTAGLTAFRQQHFADAQAHFAALAADTARPAALRGNAAFWAARSAEAAGKPEAAKPFLEAAAKNAEGFYALLAKTRLGLDTVAASARKLPTPSLAPDGGFTQDKALIYALVKAESRFNASARAGANLGLMQINAATAARLGVKGDLLNAGANLKAGQAYVAKLLDGAKGDLVRAVAGYNLGPGAVQRATAALGAKADALLTVESLPGENVRSYVRRVLADYWGYRTALKQDTGALELAAVAPTLGG